MHPIIAKSLGGLSIGSYLRHFVFGVALNLIFLWLFNQDGKPLSYSLYLMWALNTLLYPYSRFAYERLVHFFLGENFFVVNAVVFLFAKFLTMALCWMAAIFIAPLGLAYLYFVNDRASKAAVAVTPAN